MPIDPSFRALSGLLQFTVRRHTFNKDSFINHKSNEDSLISRARAALRSDSRRTASMPRGDNWKGFKDFGLKAKARIWPSPEGQGQNLAFACKSRTESSLGCPTWCHIRSTAALPLCFMLARVRANTTALLSRESRPPTAQSLATSAAV